MQQMFSRSAAVFALLAAVGCGAGDASDSTADARVGKGADVQSAAAVEAERPLTDSNGPAAGPDTPTGADLPPRSSTGTAGDAMTGESGGDGEPRVVPAAEAPVRPASSSAAPGDPSPRVATDANEILLRAERAYAQVRSIQADFVQRVYVPLLDSTQHSRGTIYHRSPDRFLMRFSDPAGDVVVADGRYIWMYYPSTDEGQVMRAPLAASGQQADLYREFLSNATQRFTATRTGDESVGGRAAKELTLVPRGASPYSRVRIWVDDQDGLVRRFEITEENGTIRHLEMSGLRSNVELADGIFRFTPPAGAQVHDF